LPPLQAGAYPDVEMGGAKWNASVNGGPAGAAAGFKSFIQQVTGGSQGAGASAAMNKYALEGVGQSGGGSRRRRHRKIGTRHRRGGAPATGALTTGAPAAMAKPTIPPAATAMAKPTMGAPAVGASTRVKVGGMFATFGALLKEALVPLGLLAAQQTYGRTYGKKHRSSGSHTRKHRR
jgi:hypothetical protein